MRTPCIRGVLDRFRRRRCEQSCSFGEPEVAKLGSGVSQRILRSTFAALSSASPPVQSVESFDARSVTVTATGLLESLLEAIRKQFSVNPRENDAGATLPALRIRGKRAIYCCWHCRAIVQILGKNRGLLSDSLLVDGDYATFGDGSVRKQNQQMPGVGRLRVCWSQNKTLFQF